MGVDNPLIRVEHVVDDEILGRLLNDRSGRPSISVRPQSCYSRIPAPRWCSGSVGLLPGQLEHELLPCIIIHSGPSSRIVDLVGHLL